MFIHAHLAAIWGLIVALESSKDFFVLCTAYANVMVTANYIDLGFDQFFPILQNNFFFFFIKNCLNFFLYILLFFNIFSNYLIQKYYFTFGK